MSKLLALDQSSRISGYAIFDNDKLIKYGKFTANQDDIGDRLVYIKKIVHDLIIDYNIDEVIMEDIQLQTNVGNNVQTFKILAEVFGVIYELVTEMKIPHTAVLAATWKSALSIKGRTRPEQKRNIQDFVEKTFSIRPTQDECDAIAIGAHRFYKKVPKEEDGFDWS